ncbi:MAG: DUF3276 family protein [Candidatus Magasanikbacteria bacterium]|nr:DUF3276 family protein [Candidatus Magasanikbacteria bacterium]
MDKSIKRDAVKSSTFRIGKKTFFFDVNLAANDKMYLKITESRFVEEGKDRIRNSFVLFPEEITEFEKNLNEMIGYLN